MHQAGMFGRGREITNPVDEWETLKLDLELIQQADRYGFKYAWPSEHHALAGYSHMSASESFIPYALATTERIHVGSGIWPLNPVTNHPIRLAERAAMCDQLSNGRFEFGTGRGAGSYEVGTFGLDPSETKAIWDEVIPEFKKMWESHDPRMTDHPGYTHEGAAFSVASARGIYPKPYGGAKTHPALWTAVGNLPTFEKAARHGIGALGFGFLVSGLEELKPYVDTYKETVANAEPVGQYTNDNFAVACLGLCLEDGQEARREMTRAGMNEILSLVYLYHDTFPMPDWGKRWPDKEPNPTLEQVDEMIKGKAIVCGDPDEVIEQLQGYADIGVDQIAFGVPSAMPREVALETIRVFGEKVIPHFDKDPIHRTTRLRYGAQAEAIVADAALGAQPFDSSALRVNLA